MKIQKGRLLWAQQKRWHRQGGDVYSKQKKKKEKKNDKWHKVKSVPCAQTVPALAIAAADVGESARLDALPHFFFTAFSDVSERI